MEAAQVDELVAAQRADSAPISRRGAGGKDLLRRPMVPRDNDIRGTVQQRELLGDHGWCSDTRAAAARCLARSW